MKENEINKEWFQSTEALYLFKELMEKIQYEPSKEKINVESKLYALFGTNETINDPNKFAILISLSQLTDNQRELLYCIGSLSPIKRDLGSEDLEYEQSAIWSDMILQEVKSGKYSFSGQQTIMTDLRILESFCLLKQTIFPADKYYGFNLTAFGKLAFRYLIRIKTKLA